MRSPVSLNLPRSSGVVVDAGEDAQAIGKYVVVHESQDDGSTKIVLDIFNSNMPRPGSAPLTGRTKRM
jgi:hypothetical protein